MIFIFMSSCWENITFQRFSTLFRSAQSITKTIYTWLDLYSENIITIMTKQLCQYSKMLKKLPIKWNVYKKAIKATKYSFSLSSSFCLHLFIQWIFTVTIQGCILRHRKFFSEAVSYAICQPKKNYTSQGEHINNLAVWCTDSYQLSYIKYFKDLIVDLGKRWQR